MATVLIADDSRVMQMLVMRALHGLGNVQFLSAENGRQALELLRGQAVDLVVTDVNMPEMDGLALVREVRRTRAKHELPILMLTARGEVGAREDGLSLGANAYVLKPLSGVELLREAQALLEHRA